jgi:heme-degrading monooxygenase HmoA
MGHVAGPHIAEGVYDDHIDDVRRAKDEVWRGMAATKAWMKAREAQTARRALNEFQTYTRPPQARERF